jgi:hypothetical protein
MMNHDSEFAHMHNVFMPIDRDRPELPFSEFITDSGLHKIVTNGTGKYENNFFAYYSIPRDGGTIGVSLVCGAMFYCTPDAPYEVMVNGTGDPRGYVTDEQLMIMLAKLISGESPYDV